MDIAIVGAGMAGLSAGWWLRRDGHRVMVFERNYKPGGRMNSRRKAGLVVDHGEKYFRRDSPILRELIMDCGLHGELVAVENPVYTLQADGSFAEKPQDAIDLNRATFAGGVLTLAEAVRRQMGGFNSMRVTRVSWEEEAAKFVVETEPPLREADRLYDGVLFACPADEALIVSEPLRALMRREFVERLGAIRYDPCFTLIAALDKVVLPTPFYALRTASGVDTPLRWIAFEDMKCRGRAVEGWSSLVAHAKPDSSARFMAMDEEEALAEVYAEVRRLVPQTPGNWRWARAKCWESARLRRDTQPATHEEFTAAVDDVPLEFAGDYRVGDGVENAAKSGRLAAESLIVRLARNRA